MNYKGLLQASYNTCELDLIIAIHIKESLVQNS